MKKFCISLLICIMAVLTLSVTACGDNKGGTYYPNNSEMATNLETSGYIVTISTDLDDKSGIHLSATKENEYIEFYWLDNSADCDYFYNILEKTYTNYNSLVKIENDEKFGNIVYCGTEKAVNAAGIKIVKVKV